ncbi:Flp pilus assembly protein TadG [Tistlia consotensis]|uniref:Flp pilus assembly protein TadG n=1 Tax=Tistlia consotensis USBA 355 TaxID=560819 RepID=A0A1Y6BQ63_9PROT|nr:TadE/TadG family type IV pilus assembly protein [Tistlia consotensis]SMF12675.1 Flp pilus assembly protein TadG [Tistlia consotensis USBA 355]SNR50950.1 Flp pilus assembly protein TadG [Tistlia consotensis]
MSTRDRIAERLAGLSSGLHAFRKAERGGVAILLAGLLVPLIAFTGLAVDAGRAYLVKARLSQSIDAAALAGGRVFYDANRDSDVTMFFHSNFPDGFMGASVSPLAIVGDGDAGTLTVSADATVQATFLKVIGVDDITVSARSVVQRADRGLELALVMDNTGSMTSNDRIGSMKSAAHELLGILYGNRNTVPNLWVGLVPYTAAVNIGRGNASWLASGSLDALAYEYSSSQVSHGNCDGTGINVAWNNGYSACTIGDTRELGSADGINQTACASIGVWDSHSHSCLVADGWKGCVEARWGAAGRDRTDDPPSVEAFQPYFWPRWFGPYGQTNSSYNSYLPNDIDETEATNITSNNGLGPNLGCGPAITPLTGDRSVADAAIDAMGAWHRGGTTTNLGVVWGWRVLSPRWRGLWNTDPTLPLDYDAPLMDKAVVILTDGDNNLYNGMAPSGDTDYTGYQRLSAGRLGTTNRDTARQRLNDRMVETCNAMKQQGIIIYTVTFQVANNSSGDAIRQVFRSCATSPGNYFDSYDGSDLSTAFRTIATQLANLRIAQ